MITALPAARVPDPRDAPTMRWGIVGPGWIAERFARSLRRFTDQQVTAVASRSLDRAQAFAGRTGIDTAYGSYDELYASDAVDIVYVATPHTEHRSCTLGAIARGKHVLVEKPLALDAAGATDIADAAARAGVFAGEAMWTRFLPKFDVIDSVLSSGMLGRVDTVIADHGEHFGPDHRIFDPTLAGGPLLDLGTYVVSLAYTVLGPPATVSAVGLPANDEINGQISALLTAESGAHAVLTTTMTSTTPTTASLCGTEATLHVPGPFFMPGPFTVTAHSGASVTYDEAPGLQVDGLHYAAVDASRAIADGRLQSSVHPLADAVGTLAVLDELRAQVGIEFPVSR